MMDLLDILKNDQLEVETFAKNSILWADELHVSLIKVKLDSWSKWKISRRFNLWQLISQNSNVIKTGSK